MPAHHFAKLRTSTTNTQPSSAAVALNIACSDQLRSRSITDARPSDLRAPVSDALRASQPRRGPRADLIDQKLRPPRRCWADADGASKFSSAIHCHANRATQEPLEPLAPAVNLLLASPPLCAFCGHHHVPYVFAVYKRPSLSGYDAPEPLRRCFDCLGQDHRSSSCSKMDAM